MLGARPLRVVVAGTSFGRVYLSAVRSASEQFVLAGVLARGSDYSRRCARDCGVPLYTSPGEVPDDVDIACVVVRSGVTGGPGAELAQAMLRRGIHVLQEHPVHPDELIACLRAARSGGAVYHVSTLYPHVEPIRRFLVAARTLRSRQPLLFADAAGNSQVAYPLLDVLGQALGGLRPWAFARPAPVDQRLGALAAVAQPFQSLYAVLGGVPVTLRVQNQVHPGDPDNHALLMHRIAVGTEGGVLTLADTHGPVLWNPRMHAPRDGTGRLVMDGAASERLDVASTAAIGSTTSPTYREVFSRLWPDAVLGALTHLRREITLPPARRVGGQWALGVSRVWAGLTAQLGAPELIRPPEPRPVALAELMAARDDRSPQG